MKYIKLIPFWLVVPLMIFVPALIIILAPSRPFTDPLWEIVPTPVSSGQIMRTPVPHGWIVMYKDLARGIVYIPDEKHEWKIKETTPHIGSHA